MVVPVVVFDQIRNIPKPYYSPDIYCNPNEPITLYPRKKIVVVFCNTSKYHRQTDQYHLLFSKGHFFYKIDYYKFCIVIFNKSFKSKLICDTHTHCSLTKLLSHKTEERYKNCRKLLQKKMQLHYPNAFIFIVCYNIV